MATDYGKVVLPTLGALPLYMSGSGTRSEFSGLSGWRS
jgi:hypothetical protein